MNPILQQRVMGMHSERIIGSFTQDSVTLTKCSPTIPFRQRRKQCSLQKHQQDRRRQRGCRALCRRQEKLWLGSDSDIFASEHAPCQVALWCRWFNPLLIPAALWNFPLNHDKNISKGRRQTSSPGITQRASIIHQNGKVQHTGETTSALVKKSGHLKD